MVVVSYLSFVLFHTFALVYAYYTECFDVVDNVCTFAFIAAVFCIFLLFCFSSCCCCFLLPLCFSLVRDAFSFWCMHLSSLLSLLLLDNATSFLLSSMSWMLALVVFAMCLCFSFFKFLSVFAPPAFATFQLAHLRAANSFLCVWFLLFAHLIFSLLTFFYCFRIFFCKDIN